MSGLVKTKYIFRCDGSSYIAMLVHQNIYLSVSKSLVLSMFTFYGSSRSTIIIGCDSHRAAKVQPNCSHSKATEQHKVKQKSSHLISHRAAKLLLKESRGSFRIFNEQRRRYI